MGAEMKGERALGRGVAVLMLPALALVSVRVSEWSKAPLLAMFSAALWRMSMPRWFSF